MKGVIEERQTRRRPAGSRHAYENREVVSLLPLLGSEAKQTKNVELPVIPGNKAEGGRLAS